MKKRRAAAKSSAPPMLAISTPVTPSEVRRVDAERGTLLSQMLAAHPVTFHGDVRLGIVTNDGVAMLLAEDVEALILAVRLHVGRADRAEARLKRIEAAVRGDEPEPACAAWVGED